MEIDELEKRKEQLEKEKLNTEKKNKLNKQIKTLENEKKPFFKSLKVVGNFFKGSANVAGKIGSGTIKMIDKIPEPKPMKQYPSQVIHKTKTKKQKKKVKKKQQPKYNTGLQPSDYNFGLKDL